MHIGISCNQRDNGKVRPLARVMVEGVEYDQKRQGPELLQDSHQDARIDTLREKRAKYHSRRADHKARNREQCRLSRTEPEVAQ